jgi:hypothetical protein
VNVIPYTVLAINLIILVGFFIWDVLSNKAWFTQIAFGVAWIVITAWALLKVLGQP